MVHEHSVIRIEYFSNKKQEPFFGQTAHVESGFPNERNFQFFFQVSLFACDLENKFIDFNYFLYYWEWIRRAELKLNRNGKTPHQLQTILKIQILSRK